MTARGIIRENKNFLKLTIRFRIQLEQCFDVSRSLKEKGFFFIVKGKATNSFSITKKLKSPRS